MTFDAPSQQATYERVRQWLEQVRYQIELRADEPVILVRAGSSLVALHIAPWGRNDAAIRIRALVVRGARLEPALTEFLLRENARLELGAFGLDGDDIVFEHSLVGSSCDLDELVAALAAVSQAADVYDNQIVAKWGGRRALDFQTGL